MTNNTEGRLQELAEQIYDTATNAEVPEALAISNIKQYLKMHTADLLAMLDSAEVGKRVSQALWETDLLTTDEESDILTEVAIAAIKEQLRGK